MDWLINLFGNESVARTVILLAAAGAAGTALGKLKVRGVGLGVAGVLFAGLALGHLKLAPHHEVLDFVREFGLILFVYTLGLQIGPGFFASLRSRGLMLNLFAASVVLYLLFVVRQRTAASPLMDLRLLVRRPVATGALLILVATALRLMVFFLGTFYLQDYRSFGPLATGLLFLPVAIATMVGANLTGRIIGALGARTLAVAGLLIAAVGMGIPALLEGTTAMVIGVAVAAAGTGALFVVASATALGQIAPEEAGLAAGLVSTFHEFGASLGAAVVSSMAAAGIHAVTTAGESAGAGDGFATGFATGAVVALVAAVIALVVTPPKQG